MIEIGRDLRIAIMTVSICLVVYFVFGQIAGCNERQYDQCMVQKTAAIESGNQALAATIRCPSM